MIRCSRCGRPAPIDPEELVDGGGDPSLPVVVVPPQGWIADLDDDEGGLVCGDCAEPWEIVEWMAGMALAEEIMAEEE